MTKKKNPHAVALGRKGGSRSTPAKRAAARRNGHAPKRTSQTPPAGSDQAVAVAASARQKMVAGAPVTPNEAAAFLANEHGFAAAVAWAQKMKLEQPPHAPYWEAVEDVLMRGGR